VKGATRALAFAFGLLVIVAAFWFAMNFVENPEISSLPYFTFRTLLRIAIALGISIAWGVPFGILASTNRTASLILVPFIDLLQSIPILGYFPIIILFLVSLFPASEIGIELSAILLLFTSMAWAIFFGVVGAVRGIPVNIVEAAQGFGLTGSRYIRHVILPAIVPALISGATLAWCDGWFFMIAAEYVVFLGATYSVPGLGSYLAKAAYVYNDLTLSVVLLALITSIVLYINFLTWHRLMERASTGTYKPVVKLGLSGLGKLGAVMPAWMHLGDHIHRPKSLVLASKWLKRYTRLEKAIAFGGALAAALLIVYSGAGRIPSVEAFRQAFTDPELVNLPIYTALTLGRLSIAYAVSLGFALGMGVLAAESKKFAALFYPIYDIGQAVPILALFPVFFVALSTIFGGRIGLEITAVIVLVLDMIWYMFLNIVGAVRSIPTEIREVGQLFSFKGIRRIRHLILPAILPAIATGSILSWGTGWNTIIFAEYMPYETDRFGGEPLTLPGLGSYLDKTGYLPPPKGSTIRLLFLLGVMAAIVLLMEAAIWRRLLRRFEKYRIEV